MLSGRLRRGILWLLLVAVATPALGAVSVEWIDESRRLIQVAVDYRDAPTLDAVADRLSDVPEEDPLAWLARYYQALALYRQGELLYAEEKEREARGILVDATELAEDAVDLNPEASDALALLGGCLAAQGRGLFRKVLQLKRAENMLDKAIELNPANPRAWLTRGVKSYYVARGDRAQLEQALKELERATELFEQASAPSLPTPQWGHDEAWGYRALVHIELGELSEARVALESAGFLNPDSRWITNHLQERLAQAIEAGD